MLPLTVPGTGLSIFTGFMVLLVFLFYRETEARGIKWFPPPQCHSERCWPPSVRPTPCRALVLGTLSLSNSVPSLSMWNRIYQPDSWPCRGGPALEAGQEVPGVQDLRRDSLWGAVQVQRLSASPQSQAPRQLCSHVVNNKPRHLLSI